MKELTLHEIQQQSLEILSDVHSFCEANEIKYSLAYGTLIGAVRHKGFIPWDDDIDIIMLRPEYDRFCEKYSSEQYRLVCNKNDKSCMMAYAKVCDVTNTISEEHSWTGQKVGLGIDIFPMDVAEDDFNMFAARYNRVSKIWNKLWLNRSIQTGERSFYSKKMNLLIRITNKFGLQCLNQTIARRKVLKMTKIASMINSTKTGHSTMMVFCDDGTKSYYESSVFNEYAKLQFENKVFWAVKDYDRMLKPVYGDYMQLPPVEQRTSKHEKVYWK